MFPPSGLPLPGEILLITDELLAPADFLLHRQVATHLKASKVSKCVLISISEDIGRWKAVAQRSNINSTQYLDSGSLSFIDAMPIASTAIDGESSVPLKELFQKISATLIQLSSESGIDLLVVLDDIASLEWVGIPAADVVRFARALCALCRKLKASLVLRHHVTTPGEPDDIFKHLFQLCTYHLDVFPLSTGRSGTVSGQVALHCGPATLAPAHRLVPRSAAVHYRLSDTGSVFFDRGTGSGVL
ncbi:hypothetical protein PYCCODRAFT_1365097 [Trametes coccinea BRFM310]|uniref:Elongator complex protein 5 n=1 Tax=Trametes coccinea (strain BRFM310) TaxID=1353009 RepID=A0A1Y2ISL0_TRAC3|nr:hypothetical protein PYCCODRAFT_1365097 [Trametes coccinea BRFM310]